MVRWALLLAGALLLLDHIQNPLVIGALVFLAATNLVGLKMVSSDTLYERVGRPLMVALRYLDAVVVAGISATSGFMGDKLWLLLVPMLIAHAVVMRNRNQVLLMGAVVTGIYTSISLVSGGSVAALALPLCAIGVGVVFGIGLGSAQSREERLAARDKRLASVLECGTALAGNPDLRSTILHTLKAAIIETKASCGYVMLIDDEARDQLLTEVAYHAEGSFDFPEQIGMGMGMSGYVAKMGQAVSISSKGDDHNEFDGVTAGVRSAACVPLVTRGFSGGGSSNAEQVLGVMTLLDLTNSDAFKDEDMELLRTLGALIAVAVSNARMEERRRTTFLRTMESLATALEARDVYTRGHSQRVCELSMMIGERMGLGAEALEELRIGTILHDIGKIGVPDEILNKRARLTDEEFEVMKSHPVIGYEICKPLMLSEGVLMIIRNHHEKLDGSGYPDGLKGGELPLSLRIVCAADAFDAMSSRRPYRGVMEISTVLAEMSRCAGVQFDPVVVENLKELLATDRMQDLYRQYWETRDQLAPPEEANPELLVVEQPEPTKKKKAA
jgi:putative nucleotidyltransferase with HDIG domain